MIYIACPEKLATGGTELLHQLYYEIKKKTDKVRIYYYNYSNNGDPTAERFKKYNVNYVKTIKNAEGTMILPEIATELLNNNTNMKKMVWWLSVDNYYKSFNYPKKSIKGIFKKIYRIITNFENRKKVNFQDDNITHLVQSNYAKYFLMDKNVSDIEFLSDYLSDIYLEEKVEYNSKNRKDQVLYNPKKGIEFTQQIIRQATDIKFIPIQNLTQQGVIDLCKSSKVYIDFGNHPGKDRLPRETALLGCTVITGTKGSAKFYEDVKISEKFKFEDREDNIPKIINQIRNNIKNYDKEIEKYGKYRQMILSERKKFKSDVNKIFDKYLNQFI